MWLWRIPHTGAEGARRAAKCANLSGKRTEWNHMPVMWAARRGKCCAHRRITERTIIPKPQVVIDDAGKGVGSLFSFGLFGSQEKG